MGALLDTPDLFQSYIAIDPSLWWDNHVLIQRAKDELQDARERSSSVYISLAHRPDHPSIDTARMDQATRDFADTLSSAASQNIRSTFQYFESEDHGSVPLLSLYHGLLFVFEGFKPPFSAHLKHPSAVSTHFERMSDQLGVVLLPPEVYVIQLGYTLLHESEDVEGALELFKLNATNSRFLSRLGLSG